MKLREDNKVLNFDIGIDATETARAWTKFLANRNSPSMPTMGVRQIIYNSWERSSKIGIRAGQFAAPSIEKTVLNERQEFFQSEMRQATRTCLHNMDNLLAGTEAMLILTDKDGVILETVGDNSTLNKGSKINLSVGGVWSESAAGTNGIGTALWANQPVFVHGEEHFCEGMKAWSCAAAPIHAPVDQSIIGVINLSGMTKIFQKHNAAFVAALARDIEELLLQSIWKMNFKLLEWAVGSKPSRAITGNDNFTIINCFGRLIFDKSGSDSSTSSLTSEKLGKPFLDLSGNITEETILSALPSKFTCKEVELIELNGIVKGASLILEVDDAGTSRKRPTNRTHLPGVEIGRTGLTIVGRSEAIRSTLEAAYSLFETNTPTLIQGETGVGKQLFAKLIHTGNTPFKTQPFTSINCAALTRELLESDFSKPNAVNSDKSGSDPKNDNLFLVFDEIGELSFELQALLLRLLEKVTLGLGTLDATTQDPTVRVLSLTNRCLLAEVGADRFRRDLYYRLGAVVLEIPPLRDRGEDILLIFEHYNRLLATQSGRETLVLSADVEQALLAHDWPGNVRELCNAVSSLHHKVKGRSLTISDLPFNMEGRETKFAPTRTEQRALRTPGSASLKDSELSVVESALIEHSGNLSKAAITLGISRPTLYRKMERYRISVVDGKTRRE